MVNDLAQNRKAGQEKQNRIVGCAMRTISSVISGSVVKELSAFSVK